MSLKTLLTKTNKNRMIPFLKQVKNSYKSLMVNIFLIYIVPYKSCPRQMHLPPLP